jgi:hypothetical protein
MQKQDGGSGRAWGLGRLRTLWTLEGCGRLGAVDAGKTVINDHCALINDVVPNP